MPQRSYFNEFYSVPTWSDRITQEMKAKHLQHNDLSATTHIKDQTVVIKHHSKPEYG